MSHRCVSSATNHKPKGQPSHCLLRQTYLYYENKLFKASLITDPLVELSSHEVHLRIVRLQGYCLAEVEDSLGRVPLSQDEASPRSIATKVLLVRLQEHVEVVQGEFFVTLDEVEKVAVPKRVGEGRLEGKGGSEVR